MDVLGYELPGEVKWFGSLLLHVVSLVVVSHVLSKLLRRQAKLVGHIRCKKSKGKFLYSAVSSPQDCSKRFTLYFPDRPVHSDTISASLGSIQPYAASNARRLLVHISTTVYSQVLILIQLSELDQSRVKKLGQGFNTAARIRTRVLVVESPKLYP